VLFGIGAHGIAVSTVALPPDGVLTPNHLLQVSMGLGFLCLPIMMYYRNRPVSMRLRLMYFVMALVTVVRWIRSF